MMISGKKLARLLQDLAGGDASKRRLAAEALADTDERAVYPLIRALRDENTGVQDAAMRSLIRIGGETTAYMALPLLREDALLRNTAIIMLRDIGPVSVPLLYPLLKDKDDDVRKFSIDLLMDIREGVDAGRIIPLIADPNPNVRAAAAKAAGVLGCRDAVPELVAALRDEEWVCFSALEALGELRDESAVGPIAGLLGHESATSRCAAIEALGRIGGAAAEEALNAYLPKTDDFEKMAVLKSLLLMGAVPQGKGVAGTLLEMFRAGDWEERVLCVRGLAAVGHYAAIREVIDAAGSLDASEPDGEDILLRIKDGLRRFGCPDAFQKIVEDPAFRFRGKCIAVELIGEMRCEAATELLIRQLQGGIRDIKRACAVALGNIGGDAARHALIAAVEDHDSHVRKAAVAALGAAADRDAFDAVTRLIRGETYQDVLEEAVRAALAIDPDRFMGMLEDYGGRVQEIAGWYAREA